MNNRKTHTAPQACKAPDDLKNKFVLLPGFLSNYVEAVGNHVFETEADAMIACIKFKGGGITNVEYEIGWQVRCGSILQESPHTWEFSWVLQKHNRLDTLLAAVDQKIILGGSFRNE